jgi:hypothetical protein
MARFLVRFYDLPFVFCLSFESYVEGDVSYTSSVAITI